ncbi:hypothetical protein FRC07_008446, partial [Ceratobasidium sp. 392]
MGPCHILLLVLSLLPLTVAQSTQIMIDDSLAYSPSYPMGIQYFGSSWLTNNTNHDLQRFNGTSHVARTLGDGFIFSFHGAQISWYADGDYYGGPITLYLDGANYTVNNSAPTLTLRQNLWTSPMLDPGDHQVIVVNTGGTLIGLDNFAITPNDGSTDVAPTSLGPGSTTVPSGSTLTDDSDPSITYTGTGWQQISGTYFQQSMHTTSTLGDSCTFNFTGTQVFYFSSDLNNSATVGISIDGGSAVTVNNTANGNSNFVQKLLWSSPTLQDGQHSITLTHTGAAGSVAGLDFFMYKSNNPPPANSTTPTASPSPTASSTPSSKSPTGAIIGGTIGGVILLAAMALVGFILARRKGLMGGGSQSDHPSVKYFPSYEAYGGTSEGHGTVGAQTYGTGGTQNYGSGWTPDYGIGPGQNYGNGASQNYGSGGAQNYAHGGLDSPRLR